MRLAWDSDQLGSLAAWPASLVRSIRLRAIWHSSHFLAKCEKWQLQAIIEAATVNESLDKIAYGFPSAISVLFW